jgi:hypothetical protein
MVQYVDRILKIEFSLAYGWMAGDSTAPNADAVSSATPKDLLPVKASPNESDGQGLDTWAIAAKGTGDLEAESPLVASRIAASEGANVPASLTPSKKSKAGVHSLQFACNVAMPCKLWRMLFTGM